MIWKYFLSFYRSPFHSVNCPVTHRNVLFWYSPIYVYFFAYTFDVISKKLPNPVSWGFSPMFSSKCFIFLALRYPSCYTLWSGRHLWNVCYSTKDFSSSRWALTGWPTQWTQFWHAAWRWRQTPQVKSPVPQDAPASGAIRKPWRLTHWL